MSLKKIIVIDDEVNICRSITACLIPEGYDVLSFSEGESALKAMHKQYFDLAIIDIRLGQESGIGLYEKMSNAQIEIPVIFISGNASLDEAASTVKLGAYDFLEKPFNADKLIVTVNNCISFLQMSAKVKAIELEQSKSLIIGEHQLIKTLKEEINKVANSHVNVLITGESGTGKELVAQAIHDKSGRADQNIVKVNCSAIPENLFESALFGHLKGAFTGADKHKKGFFEMADKGTLFLDEIADVPLASQASLLRALENKEIQKVGSDHITRVDIRLLAASHKNLKELVASGQFREDLYYRLNVIPIHSPSLKERSSDIPLLASYFIRQLCKRHGMKNKSIAPSCLELLASYHWPGNVRELINAMERMLIMGGETLNNTDVPSEILYAKLDSHPDNTDMTLKGYLRQVERKLLIERLREYQGNITKVATSLAIDRSYLHKKLTLHNIKREQNFE
jgi:two-component system nitrogen regulation response regulator NtrX